jgi:hypothetical protein
VTTTTTSANVASAVVASELRKDLQQVPELFVEVLPVTAWQPEECLPSLVR